MNIGEILRKEREKLGYSIDDVSRELKIHHSVLEALENNNYELIPTLYITGFLKKYCNYLKFEDKKVKEIIDYFNENIAKTLDSKGGSEWDYWEPERKNNRILKLLLYVSISILMIFGFYWGYSRYNVVKKSPKLEKKNIDYSKKEKMEKKILNSDTNRVAIRVLKKVFVTVYEGGDLVFSGVLKKGAKEEWKSEKPIILRVALPDSVFLEINGVDVGVIKQNMAYPNEVVVKKGKIIVRHLR